MAFLRRHPVVTSLMLLGALVLGIVTASAVAVWRAAHTDEARQVDHADVIVVLGAAQYGGRPSPVFKGRLDHAALLFERGFGEEILVLGAGQPGDVSTEGGAGAAYLEGRGIPPERVSSSPRGSTTLESLREAVETIRADGDDSAFLVSDPWHNLRIRRMARDLGIDGFVSATWHSAAKSQQTRFGGYVRETFAYLVYRLAGK